MKTLSTAVLISALALMSFVQAEVDETAAIRSLNSNWDAAINKGNTAELAKLYAKDAVVMPPSSEILASPEAIRNYWDGLRKVGVNEYTVRTVETRIEGDTAYQTALWEATRTADGQAIQFEGNISNVLERQKDGSWKIRLQSWN